MVCAPSYLILVYALWGYTLGNRFVETFVSPSKNSFFVIQELIQTMKPADVSTKLSLTFTVHFLFWRIFPALLTSYYTYSLFLLLVPIRIPSVFLLSDQYLSLILNTIFSSYLAFISTSARQNNSLPYAAFSPFFRSVTFQYNLIISFSLPHLGWIK